jgi:hypothetical protein
MIPTTLPCDQRQMASPQDVGLFKPVTEVRFFSYSSYINEQDKTIAIQFRVFVLNHQNLIVEVVHNNTLLKRATFIHDDMVKSFTLTPMELCKYLKIYTDYLIWDSEESLKECDRFEAESAKRCTKLDESIAKHDASIAKHKEDIAKYDASIAKHDAKTAKLDASIAKHDASIAKHDASIAKHDAKTAKLDASIAKHDASIAKHDASIAKHDASIAKHDASIAEWDKKNEEQRMMLKRLEEEAKNDPILRAADFVFIDAPKAIVEQAKKITNLFFLPFFCVNKPFINWSYASLPKTGDSAYRSGIMPTDSASTNQEETSRSTSSASHQIILAHKKKPTVSFYVTRYMQSFTWSGPIRDDLAFKQVEVPKIPQIIPPILFRNYVGKIGLFFKLSA